MKSFHTSGLPLPRFVSLEDEKTYVRAGPGEQYPIKWIVERKGLPVEIVLEYDNWRKIKDIEGQEGWVFHSLLSGERTGLVKSDSSVAVYQKPYDVLDKNSEKSMMLESGVLVVVEKCEKDWCFVTSAGFSGWLQRKFIWGVYAHENFD